MSNGRFQITTILTGMMLVSALSFGAGHIRGYNAGARDVSVSLRDSGKLAECPPAECPVLECPEPEPCVPRAPSAGREVVRHRNYNNGQAWATCDPVSRMWLFYSYDQSDGIRLHAQAPSGDPRYASCQRDLAAYNAQAAQ